MKSKLILDNHNMINQVVVVVDPPVYTYHSVDNEKLISMPHNWHSAAADKLKGKFIEEGIVVDANVHDELGLCLLVNRPLSKTFEYGRTTISSYGYSVCASIESYYKTKKHIYQLTNIKCEDYQSVALSYGCNVGTQTYNIDIPEINKKFVALKTREIRNNNWRNDCVERLDSWKKIHKFNSVDLKKLFPNVVPNKALAEINKLIKEQHG